jgi:anti-sigma regulatory factor (Ser/Thr protein kinase)
VANATRLTDLGCDGEAVISELVANAVAASSQAAPPGAAPAPVTLWITVQRGELCIRVWDPDPTPPPRDYVPGTWDENGRGLLIVKALSHRWDWYPAEGGKYVWAALSLSEQPPGGSVSSLA